MMETVSSKRMKVEVINKGAPIWLTGWLFTIGFAKLGFWKGLLGLVVWPYYLGVAVG